MSTAFDWVQPAVIAAVMACAINLDGLGAPDDVQAAQDVADDYADTLAAAAHDAATTSYAQALADGGKALCARHGREPVFTNTGDLICRLPAATPKP